MEAHVDPNPKRSAEQNLSKKILRPLISVGAVALLLVHRRSEPPFDAVALGLVALAVLPWLSGVLQTAEIAGIKLEFKDLEREQERQKRELNWTKKLIAFAVSDRERAHLRRLAAEGSFSAEVERHSGFELELRHLIALDFVGRHPGQGIRTLFPEHGKEVRDVKEHLTITPRGREYLNIFDEANV